MQTRTTTYYRLMRKDQLSGWSPSDYSKYSGEQNYGYAQALEHAQEIKNHIYNNKAIHEHIDLVINVETRVITSVPVAVITERVTSFLKEYLKPHVRSFYTPANYAELVGMSEDEEKVFTLRVFDKQHL